MKINTRVTNPQCTINIDSILSLSGTKKWNYDKLLGDSVIKSINKNNDYEITEFKPNNTGLNFYLYFNMYRSELYNLTITDNIEPAFTSYLNTAIVELPKIDIYSNILDKLQSINVGQPKNNQALLKTDVQVILNHELVVQDIIHELYKPRPKREGIPLFYNSFTIPFSRNDIRWTLDTLKFSDKAFLYNSFMMIEFFSEPTSLSGIPLFSSLIFVNNRYMQTEVSKIGLEQVRPVFNLNNNTEGYSILWPKGLFFDKLYAKFSFWDALNGQQIPFIPSSIFSPDKKWVVDENSFNEKNLYLEYSLNNENSTYQINEFNNSTGKYDIQAFDFDLYELVFDSYYTKKRIPNVRPSAVKKTKELGLNPLLTVAPQIGENLKLNKEKLIGLRTTKQRYTLTTPPEIKTGNPNNNFKYPPVAERSAERYGFYAETNNILIKVGEVNHPLEIGPIVNLDNLILKNDSGVALKFKSFRIKSFSLVSENNFITWDQLSFDFKEPITEPDKSVSYSFQNYTTYSNSLIQTRFNKLPGRPKHYFSSVDLYPYLLNNAINQVNYFAFDKLQSTRNLSVILDLKVPKYTKQIKDQNELIIEAKILFGYNFFSYFIDYRSNLKINYVVDIVLVDSSNIEYTKEVPIEFEFKYTP